MRILVTGGAGFIRSAYARALLADGSAEVTVLDNLSYSGNIANLPIGTPGLTFVEGLAATVAWYAGHRDWWQPLRARAALDAS